MVAQYPSILGDGVRKNCGLLVAFKLVSEHRYREDLTMTVGMLARDSRMDHREVWRFLTRLPVGWSIVRKMRTLDLVETEPVLVKWDYLEVRPPLDAELQPAGRWVCVCKPKVACAGQRPSLNSACGRVYPWEHDGQGAATRAQGEAQEPEAPPGAGPPSARAGRVPRAGRRGRSEAAGRPIPEPGSRALAARSESGDRDRAPGSTEAREGEIALVDC